MALLQELVLYKNLGETPLECLDRFRKEHPEYKDAVLSYAGRLDPMAEGLLLVIVGEANKEKKKYTNLDKEYEFEILWGVETDTYDILGKITKTSSKARSLPAINSFLASPGKLDLIGKFNQEYPPYSSKTVQGKALHQWAREGKLEEIEIPTREVEIKNIEIISHKQISLEELKKEIFRRIDLVKGDFRQGEIKGDWNMIYPALPGKSESRDEKIWITKMRATVSSGTYIRSLAHELGKKLGTHAIAYSIKRTRVGEYRI